MFNPFQKLLSKYRRMKHSRYLRSLPREQVFSEIYQNNAWGSEESVSGPGSDLEQTRTLRNELQELLTKHDIKSILDIPCGDFNWMRHLDLSQVDYTGADIVPDLIAKNKQYETNTIHFQTMDLVHDNLPKVDLILVRDCLVHLSHDDITAALKNIINSQSKYLLSTTFTQQRKNKKIETGRWRRLNLQIAPFNLPEPILLLDEVCPASQGKHADKCLGLWEINSIDY